MTTKKMEKFIQASPSEVFFYFTNSTALRDWLCDVATVDPRPGGRFYMWWTGDYYTSGEYVNVEKDKAVSFTWFGRGEPHATRVEVSFKKKKGGTLVKLAHRKIGKSQAWEAIGNSYEKEWNRYLDNLASVLEDGPDLRITNRPMLGIAVNDFNENIAEKLGVPVKQGIRLGGVVDGMGAQKAGLQADDVIVAMDGQVISGATTFAAIIENKHAGEVVEVTYYRCAEKKTTKMTLSGRPIPTIPGSGAELARQVEPVYRQYEGEIESVLNGASNEECAKKPAPAEWSANEVLAHLIHSELGWQNVVAEIMGGHQGAYDDFGGNIQAYIDGTVATFPTKDELFNQLKNHDTETFNMLSHIPIEFLAHKGRWWKLAFQANQNSYHLQTHLEQIRSAIQLAKGK
jgi:uncharacterized protein YndB with AHSA1/START domain